MLLAAWLRRPGEGRSREGASCLPARLSGPEPVPGWQPVPGWEPEREQVSGWDVPRSRPSQTGSKLERRLAGTEQARRLPVGPPRVAQPPVDLWGSRCPADTSCHQTRATIRVRAPGRNQRAGTTSRQMRATIQAKEPRSCPRAGTTSHRRLATSPGLGMLRSKQPRWGRARLRCDVRTLEGHGGPVRRAHVCGLLPLSLFAADIRICAEPPRLRPHLIGQKTGIIEPFRTFSDLAERRIRIWVDGEDHARSAPSSVVMPVPGAPRPLRMTVLVGQPAHGSQRQALGSRPGHNKTIEEA